MTPGVRVRVGFVVIGRNEGLRLRRCLRSIVDSVEVDVPGAATQRTDEPAAALPVVYVDSGSTDDSVAMARRLGISVVELDPSTKFTAARARNRGFQAFRERFPDAPYVHFVDGDCELQPGWVAHASSHLDEHPDVAVVCGRRRERFPDRSVFNRLCDLEWDTPIGEAKSCGGDALMRCDVIERVGGYRDALIAGEEPELCFRIRKLGYSVERLDHEMTLHDANMTHPSQWFRRAQRAGHAYAETAALHFSDPEQPGVRHTVSNLIWGLGLPGACALGSWLSPPAALLGATAGYTTLFARSYRFELTRRPAPDARLFALSCTAAKVPEALGALAFIRNRLAGVDSTIIEYKSADSPAPDAA